MGSAFEFKVRLHSDSVSGAEATDTTIRDLPGGGMLKRDDNYQITFDETGLATVVALDVGFLKFALKHQGYVKEVLD